MVLGSAGIWGIAICWIACLYNVKGRDVITPEAEADLATAKENSEKVCGASTKTKEKGIAIPPQRISKDRMHGKKPPARGLI